MFQRIESRKFLAAAGLVFAVALFAACSGSSADRDSAARGPAGSDGASSQTSSYDAKSGAIAGSEGAPAAGQRDSSAAPQAAGAPASSGGSLALPSQLDRKMIMVATMTVTTEDVAGGFEEVGVIATGAGGFVSSSSFGHKGDKETASVTIRVPVDKFHDTIVRLRELGKVSGEDGSSNDVTEEFTDLESRLRNLKRSEETYLGFLGRANDIGEVMQVQDRINATRAEIEQVQGRINLVQHQTDLATISVHLNPPVVGEEPKPATGDRTPLEVAADSFQASLDVLLGIATVALAVAAFSWWLLPLAVVGWLLGRRQMRAR